MADQAMEKLASELIERLGVVEAENATLRKTNEDLRAMVTQQAKTASEATIKQVDDGLLDTTCENLVKCGALTSDQVAQAKEILKSDPNAPFKVIQGFIDEKNLVKSAAAEESLRGGRIVGSSQVKRSPEDECYERMCKILHL